MAELKKDTTNMQKIGWLVDNMVCGLLHNTDYDKVNKDDKITDEIIKKILSLQDEIRKVSIY